MDLYVRRMDPVVMRKLSELAEKSGISRPEYIRRLLRREAVLDEVNSNSDRYDRLVQTLVTVVSKNTEVLESVIEKMSREVSP